MLTPPERGAVPPNVAGSDDPDGVDVSLIRWMLSLSVEERLAVLQGFTDSVAELTNARSGT